MGKLDCLTANTTLCVRAASVAALTSCSSLKLPVVDNRKRTVTRPSSPRGGGIVCRKARITLRPNSSFSPERVMSGGRTAAVDKPDGAAKLLGKSNCKESCGLGFDLAGAGAGGGTAGLAAATPGGEGGCNAGEGGSNREGGGSYRGGVPVSVAAPAALGAGLSLSTGLSGGGRLAVFSSRLGSLGRGPGASARASDGAGVGSPCAATVGRGATAVDGAAGTAGAGGAGWGSALALSALGSTNSTLMASGLPSRSPSCRGADRVRPTTRLPCSRAAHARAIQNPRSDRFCAWGNGSTFSSIVPPPPRATVSREGVEPATFGNTVASGLRSALPEDATAAKALAIVWILPGAAPMRRTVPCRLRRWRGFPQGLAGAPIGRRLIRQPQGARAQNARLKCVPQATRRARLSRRDEGSCALPPQ